MATQSDPVASQRRPRRSAFTLVELLVVIGIIALLISILLPALGKATEQGKRIKCASNVRQLCSALVVYANANRGFFPDYGNITGDFSKSGVTATNHGLQLVHPEFRDLMKEQYGIPREMFFCPSQPEDIGGGTTVIWARTDISNFGLLGYMFLAGRVELNRDKAAMATAGIYAGFEEVPNGPTVFPRKLIDKGFYNILVTDLTRSSGNSLAPSNHVTGNDSTKIVPRGSSGGSNIGYTDGHVDWKIQSLLGQGTPYNGMRNVEGTSKSNNANGTHYYF